MVLNPEHIIYLNLFIILTLGWRVISRRSPVTETLYWLAIIVLIPIFGGILFIIINERPLGRKRLRRSKQLVPILKSMQSKLNKVSLGDLEKISENARFNAKLSSFEDHFPVYPCPNIKLFSDEAETLNSIITEINSAKYSVNLCSYIWSSGTLIFKLEEALIKARSRGVICRVLLDDLGSSSFLDSGKLEFLEGHGIVLISALKAGIFRGLFRRVDIRNHRKIYTIDHEIAYTGSMNLVDSSCFKPWHDIGGWIDTTIRVEGDAARELDLVFYGDWYLETGKIIKPPKAVSNAKSTLADNFIQIVPTGRNVPKHHIQEIFLNIIYSAKRRVTLTSPYLIPSESLINALCTAARRGVEVNLITTEKSDAKIVQLASEYNYSTLFNSGVNIYLYKNGLLHSKTLTCDDDISMVGSLNLDMRSFFINFEICNFVYGKSFLTSLKDLQYSYIRRSQKIDKNWLSQSKSRKSSQLITRLISPIL